MDSTRVIDPAEREPTPDATLLEDAAQQPNTAARYTRLSDAEKSLMLRLRFRENLSYDAIAGATKRSVSTVHEYLSKFPDRSEEALAMLKAEGPRAVEMWSAALAAAAERGDHRPMRDLLIGLGVLQDKPTAAPVAVVVNVPGAPLPPELMDLPPYPDNDG